MRVPPAGPSMVRTLRNRVLVVVAIAAILMSAASVGGIRLVTDRNAERQVSIAAYTVTTWGSDAGGVRVIDAGHFTAVDTASTVVALLTEDGQVVASTSGLPQSVSELESIAASLEAGSTVRSDAGSRTFIFTKVALTGDVVFDDGARTGVASALVGIGVEGADRLVSALAVAALALLMLVLVAVALVVTAVVRRTTRSLTDLADRVESSELGGLEDSAASDYTETSAIAEAIARLDRRRDATERQLRDFVADASHELRTPLTKIQGWSELYFQRPDDAGMADRAFSSVIEESERMRILVDRLGQLARAESGTQQHERVDLAALARSTVEEVALMEQDQRVRFDGPPQAFVMGDEAALTQVVRNLVGNAMIHAGDDASITITVDASGERIDLTVADNGRGMDPSLRERAFERFVTSDRRVGTGLGLPIVLAIVMAHNGALLLTSEPGEGTSVRVSLPRASQPRAHG